MGGLQLAFCVIHRYVSGLSNTTLYNLLPNQPFPCTPHQFGRQCTEGAVCLDRDTLLALEPTVACAPGQALCPYRDPNPTYDNLGQSAIVSMQFLSQDAWGHLLLRVQDGWADVAWVYLAVMMAAGIIFTNLFIGVFYQEFAKLQQKARAEQRTKAEVLCPLERVDEERLGAGGRWGCRGGSRA